MIRKLHTRLTDPAGFAMPIVIVVSMVLMIVAAVAVTSGLNATTSSNRDRQVKVSRQAADAGLELALYHLNAVMAGETLQCLSSDGAGNMTMVDYPGGGNWCDPVTDTMADGSTIEYRISRAMDVAGTSPQQVTRRVVATGTYLGQQRRAGMRHHTVSVRRYLYGETAAIALHPQGDPPEHQGLGFDNHRIPAQADSPAPPTLGGAATS